MESSPTKPAKSRGLPVWTLLIAMLIGAVVLIGLLVTLLVTMRSRVASLESQVERAQADALADSLMVEKLKAEESRALAEQRRQLMLTHTAAATNALHQLLRQLQQTEELVTSLKNGDLGRQVAAHADLVTQARRIFGTVFPTLPSSADVVNRLEGVRRIQQGILDGAGSEFTPRDETTVEVQNATVWAEVALRGVSEAQTLLRSLVQESKIKVGGAEVTAASPTLDAAIASLNEAESIQLQRTVLAKTEVAENERRDALSDAEAKAVRDKLQVELEGLSKTAQAEREKLLAEATKRADEIVREARETAREAKIQDMRRESEGQLKESAAIVAAARDAQEAEKIKLRAKASTDEVKAALAPFITPGLTKVGRSTTTELRPLSLNELRGAGALDPSLDGMKKLANIARSARDRVRPRWNMGPTFFNDPVESRTVREAQQLLIELGDVLVELGMLDP